MRRVLFLAYHFPPIGGAGVQRSIRFVRLLRDFGYEPVVVTGSGDGGGRWTPRDESLAATLPRDLEVLRLPNEPAPPPRFRRRAENWLGLDSRFARWWADGVSEARRRAGGIDMVYASMSPYASGHAAGRVARELGKPWVVDLRDPWALDEMMVYPTSVHRSLELRRMREVLSSATAVVMNTPEAAHQVTASIPALERGGVAAIPNGWDAEDFAGPEPGRDDEAFRIVHTGYLHTELGGGRRRRVRRLLGGTALRADPLARSHLYLLEAVAAVEAAAPALAERIEVHLAGVLSDADRQALSGRRMHAHGYLAHAHTIDLIRSADLLFLPMHDLPPGTSARIVPGKTYEYLASGRPILAAVPDGDARNLLAGAPDTAFLTRPKDVAAMAKVITNQIRGFEAGGRAPTEIASVTSSYEARELTARLARVFDRVLGAAGRHPRLEVATW